jgi:hypothetical protein
MKGCHFKQRLRNSWKVVFLEADPTANLNIPEKWNSGIATARGITKMVLIASHQTFCILVLSSPLR